MSDLLNLVVDLDERFANDGAARARIERAGYVCEVGAVDDRVLAWIDETFGGAWSSETAAGTTVVAYREGVPAGFATYAVPDLRYAWLRGIAREPDVGLFGPFGVVPEERGSALGPALLGVALCGLRAKGYRRALIAAANEGLAAYYSREAGAHIVERYDPRSFTPMPVRTAVLASGNGTNFQAVLENVRAGFPLDVVALVANREDAFALERARLAGIGAIAVPWKRTEMTRAQYDARLLEAVRAREPELVLLLGWMHLLAPSFIDAFRMAINVHPAFLPLDPQADAVGMPDGTSIPAFRGAHAVADALAAGSRWVGASVHVVTPQTDRGRILVRKPLGVEPGEDERALLERLHHVEHRLVESGIRRWLYERNG